MKKLLAILMCLLLTGCNAETIDDGADSGWEEYQNQEEVPIEEPNRYPVEFTLAYHKDHTLDPITCGEGIQQDVSSLLYEPLFRLNKNFEPEGVLCESYQWSEDRLVCTLHIRQGVLFNDGSQLTAADVAATLQRAMQSERYAYRLRNIVSISHANRAGTVTITLSAPNGGLISLLDIPVVKNGTQQQMVPTGTGPYLFVTASSGPQLVANMDWWQNQQLPVEIIPLVHAKDRDTAVHLFSSGRVQLLTLDPTGGHSEVTGRNEKTERPTTQMHFIGFNTTQGIFAQKEARTAFSFGIQREVLVNAFLSNHAQAAWFPIAPDSKIYPTALNRAYNQDELLAAMTAAGQNTGEISELILLVNEEDTFRVDNAKFIAQELSLLDWKITVKALPFAEYLMALEQGEFDLYYGEVRLCADWDLTDLVGTGGTMNYGGFSDEWMDTLIRLFAETTDRKAMAQSLCTYFAEAAPIAPICFQNYTILTHTDVVEGLTCSPETTFYALEDWTIHLSESDVSK
ncbi:MAG: ABC transporter substrate-binding protein [Oscillospiraceae bacterium]|nr:ABC transporter substrate-binding protein [Oscillospiraceae bacterium]